MNDSQLLRKGVVVEIISNETFLIEDVIDKETITATMSKKFRMNDFKIEIGEIFYVTVSPFEKKKGQIILLSSFKVNQDLLMQKVKLDKKHLDLCVGKE